MAYCLSETLAGAFQAWLARAFGDDTAADLGFISLHPGTHIDLVGMICLLFFGIGWGNSVPVNHSHIDVRFHKLKVFLVVLAQTFIHMVTATISIALLVGIYGMNILKAIIPMIANYDLLSPRTLDMVYPNLSPLTTVLTFIVISIIYINAIFAAFSLIFDLFRFGLRTFMERNSNYLPYADIIAFLVPLILILFLGPYVRLLIIYTICYIGSLLGSLVCL